MQPWFTVYFLDIGHPCYGSIDTCQYKVSADQYHVTISRAQVYSSSRSRIFWSWPLTKCWFSVRLQTHVRLTSCKWGRVVPELVNANPGLKVNRSINISCIQIFFTAFVLCIFEIIQTQNRRPNNIQKTSLQSYKTQIKILPFSGLA